MTEAQEKSLKDNPLYLETHKREVFEMVSSLGIGWHPFGPYVIFESPLHNMENEDPLLVAEFTLVHRGAEATKPQMASRKSLAGLLGPDGKIADVPLLPSSAEELTPMTLKEEK